MPVFAAGEAAGWPWSSPGGTAQSPVSLLSIFLFLSFLIVLILATLILAKLVKLHSTQLAQERTIKVFLKTKLIDKLDTWDCEAG